MHLYRLLQPSVSGLLPLVLSDLLHVLDPLGFISAMLSFPPCYFIRTQACLFLF
jgi:hypothetical protein